MKNSIHPHIRAPISETLIGHFQIHPQKMASSSEVLTLIPQIPNLAVFFAFFLTIYLTAQLLVFRACPHRLRIVASSCAISFSHGTPAVLLSLHALFLSSSGPSPNNLSFGWPNTPAQARVLDYSIAYFLTDLLHYLLFSPGDLLFIAHHLATLFVFITCRFVVASGAYAILGLLILAEVTSFCQNLWTLARAMRGESHQARRVYETITLPFYVFYSVVRGLVGPWFVFQMGVFYVKESGKQHVIPMWVWASWTVVVVSALCVSALWIFNLWVELVTERKANKVGKKVE